jgi:hypothetical protein
MARFVFGLVTAAALTSMSAAPAISGSPRRPAPGPSIAVPGELTLMSLTTGATVELDGKLVGTVPFEPFTVLPGRHTIRLTKRGFAPATQEFDVAPGENVELEMDLLPFAGLVTVTSTPSGASVKVDGKVLGVTPLDTDIAAGVRVFQVSLPGHSEEARQVDVRAAAPLALDFRLNPLATASGDAFYETWWFWTIVGVAGAGTAAAVIATSGGEVTPRPDLELRIP